MRFAWLQSKVAFKLFLWSTIMCLSCFSYALFIATPLGRHIFNSSSANNAMGILFVVLVALTIPCALIIFVGMAMYCAFSDRSSVGVKVSWFLLFLVIWPLGSIVYFFTVYRNSHKMTRAEAGGTGLEDTMHL